MFPRSPIATEGNRNPTKTPRGLQRETEAIRVLPFEKSLQKSILLLRIHHLQDRRDPHKGEEGRRDPGGLLLPRFSHFLSLSLSITCAFPSSIKGEAGCSTEG